MGGIYEQDIKMKALAESNSEEGRIGSGRVKFIPNPSSPTMLPHCPSVATLASSFLENTRQTPVLVCPSLYSESPRYPSLLHYLQVRLDGLLTEAFADHTIYSCKSSANTHYILLCFTSFCSS